MSSFYELSGEIRLRNCPEIGPLIERITLLAGPGFDVSFAGDEYPPDSDVLTLTIAGGGNFACGDTSALEAAIEALGPYSVGPAIFSFEHNGDGDGDFAVAADEAAAVRAASRHALEGLIAPWVGALTAEDAATLIERLWPIAAEAPFPEPAPRPAAFYDPDAPADDRAAALRRWAVRVGRRIRHLRAGNAMTVANLAVKAAIFEADLTAAEGGLRPLNYHQLPRVALALDLRVGELDG